jgi:gliding motility-associated-like protein
MLRVRWLGFTLLVMLVFFSNPSIAQKEARTLLYGRTPTLATIDDSLVFDELQYWEHLDSNYFGSLLADAIWKDCEANRVFYARGNKVFSHQLGSLSALPLDSTVDQGTLSEINLMQAYLIPFPGDRQKLIHLNLYTNPSWVLPYFAHNVRVGIYDKSLGNNGLLQAFDLDTQLVVGVGVARHQNLRDYWILVAHRLNATNSVLRSYAVTPAGVNPVPSSTTVFYHPSIHNIYGLHMSVSPLNNRVIITAQENYLTVIDFDNSNGQVTQSFGFNFYVRFPAGPGLFGLVGGTFSGGGDRYYVYYLDARRTNVRRFLVQFNAKAADSLAFYQSLGAFNSSLFIPESFHLGRDQRLYINGRDNAIGGRLNVVRFNSPDVFGNDARPQWDYKYLFIPRLDTPSWNYYFSYSIPDFNRKNRFAIKGVDSACVGTQATYTLTEPHRLDSLRWYYYDSITGQSISSSLLEFTISFNQSSNFTLFCVAYYCDSVMLLQKQISVGDVPGNLLNDTAFCNRTSLLIPAPADGTRVRRWSTGSTANSISITTTGWYWLERENHCGFSRDSFYVSDLIPPAHGLPSDTFFCSGESVLLTALAGNYQLTWPDGDQSLQKRLYDAGTYILRLQDSCGIFYDSLKVFRLDEPGSGLIDTFTCNRRIFRFPSNKMPYTSAIWSDGSFDYPRAFTEVFNGLVRFINPCGEGTYEVKIDWIDCDCNLYAPTAFTPNGDGLNEHFSLFSTCEFSSYRIRILDRWGREMYHSEQINRGWDGTYNGEQVPEGHYSYTVVYSTGSQGALKIKEGVFYLYR